MNGLLILGLLLFIPRQSGANVSTTAANGIQSKANVTTKPSHDPSNRIKHHTISHAPSTSITTATTTTTTSVKTTTTSKSFLFRLKSECPELFMVSGIVLLSCVIFMISTLMLLCKVCQLRRRLSANDQPVSNTEYWMGTKDKGKPDSEREAKESTMLMADLSPAQGETNNGTIKEDGEKVKEDEQTPEEKEVGDAANSKEISATPVAAAENSPSPKPEEATDPQTSQAVEAASSEGKEEPDVETK